MRWSASPVTLLQTVVPLFPQDLPLREDLRALLYEGREPLLTSLYLGLPALALALAAIASSRRRLAGAAALLVGLSLLLAIGRHGLAYFWATATLPHLEVLRYPVKATLLAAFGFALVAAVGLETLRQRQLSRRSSSALALVMGVAGALTLLAVGRLGAVEEALLAPSPDHPLNPGATDSVLALATLSASAALVVAGFVALAGRASARRREALIAGVAVVAVLDLHIAHRGLNPSAPRAFVRATPRAADVLRGDGARRVYVYDYLMRLAGTESLRPDPSPALARLEKSWRLLVQAQAYPAGLPRWGLGGSYQLDVVDLDSADRRGLYYLTVAAAREPGQLLRLLRVAGVGHVVALHREGLDALTPLATITHPIIGDVHIYRVPRPLPLASAVAGVRIATGLDRYKALVDPAFDPRATVILPAGEARQPPDGFEGRVELTLEKPDRLGLRSVTSDPALLLIPEGYDEGWMATVDGQATPVLRANLAFRAVPVSAGAHEVDLAYRPASIPRGLALSGLSILATLVAVGLRRRARGTSRPRSDGDARGRGEETS